MPTAVNLITGFLGSGKTTTIQNLLKNKPANEKWAVLVNEFGEIGIDGALLANSGAVLKEIPGGCMCCVNGLPMQVGLNMLLKQAKPDRLLIEPTGLGHPKQILTLLASDVYQPVLDLRATFCLLDARQLADDRIIQNDNFRDQLSAADIIIANKSDKYQSDDLARLASWIGAQSSEKPLIQTHFGEFDLLLLDQPRQSHIDLPDSAEHQHAKTKGLAALSLPQGEDWRRLVNRGQGYISSGWIFDAKTQFSTVELLEWVRLAPVDRIKGVMHIPEGTLIFNRQGNDFHIETQAVSPVDSRVELIHHQDAPWNELQTSLLAARIK